MSLKIRNSSVEDTPFTPQVHTGGDRPQRTTRMLCMLNFQNDFVSGAAQVEGAYTCLENTKLVHSLMIWDCVVVSIVQHPPNHQSFVDSNMRKTVLNCTSADTFSFDDSLGVAPYCIIGSTGADMVIDSDVSDVKIPIRRAPDSNSWSLIQHSDGTVPTLQRVLRDTNVDEIYVCGLQAEDSVPGLVSDLNGVHPKGRIFVITECVAPSDDNTLRIILERTSGHDVRWLQLKDLLQQASSPSSIDRRTAHSDRLPVSLMSPNKHSSFPTWTFSSSINSVTPVPTLIDLEEVFTKVLEIDKDSNVQPITKRLFLRQLIDKLKNFTQKDEIQIFGDTTHNGCNTIIQGCGCSLAHIATSYLEYNLFQEFFDSRSLDPNCLTSRNESCLWIACMRNNAQIVRTLLSSSNLNRSTFTAADNQLGLTPLGIACLVGNIQIFDDIVVAAKKSNVSVEAMLRNRIKVTGQTALHLACAAAGREKVGSACYATIVSKILNAMQSIVRRINIVGLADSVGWTALHYATSSGLICSPGLRELLLGPAGSQGSASILPAMTMPRKAAIQLASWIGADNVLETLLPGMLDTEKESLSISGQNGNTFSPLDLSMLRCHFTTARVLVRYGLSATFCRGDRTQEFLQFLMLNGDGITSQLLLRDTRNKLVLSQQLAEFLRRLRYSGACTITLTAGSGPIMQYMYATSAGNVCLACAWRCQSSSHRKRLGLVYDECCCPKQNCSALDTVEVREAAGYRYDPKPIVNGNEALHQDVQDGELSHLIESLAQNSHEVWSEQKLRSGWRYGKIRDDASKLHPGLKPFWTMTAEEKKWDIQSAAEMVRVVHAFGYTIRRGSGTSGEKSLREDTSFSELQLMCNTSRTDTRTQPLSSPPRELNEIADDAFDATYVPQPINTETVQLDDELSALVDLLSQHMHESWAQNKIEAGFSYAPASMINASQDGLFSAMLVPYEFLVDSEKELNRTNAAQFIKTALVAGYDISNATATPNAAQAASARQRRVRRIESTVLRAAEMQRKLTHALVFAAARQGNTNFLESLAVAHPTWISEAVRLTDVLLRTPLHYSVLHGHNQCAMYLLEKGADPNTQDVHGSSALMLAIHRCASETLIKELVDHGARCDLRDRLGLSAIHYASIVGNLEALAFLLSRFAVFSEPDAIDMLRVMSADEASIARTDSSSNLPVSTGSTSRRRMSRAIKRLNHIRRVYPSANTSDMKRYTSESSMSDLGSGLSLRRIRSGSSQKLNAPNMLEAVDNSPWELVKVTDTKTQSTPEMACVDEIVEMHVTNPIAIAKSSDFTVEQMGLREVECYGSGYAASRNDEHNDICISLQALAKTFHSLDQLAYWLTPLNLSVHCCKVDTALLLVRRGADPTLGDASLFSPYDRSLWLHRLEHAVKSELCLTSADSDSGFGDSSIASSANFKYAYDRLSFIMSQENQCYSSRYCCRNKRRSSLCPLSCASGIFATLSYAVASFNWAAENVRQQAFASVASVVAQMRLGQPFLSNLGSGMTMSKRVFQQLVQSGVDSTELSTKLQSPISTPKLKSFSSLSSRIAANVSDSNRAVAKQEQKRQAALARTDEESKSIETIMQNFEAHAKSKSKRRRFAVIQVLKQVSHLLVLMIVFTMMSPMAPDFGSGLVAELDEALTGELSPYSRVANDPQSWWKWLGFNILWLPVGSGTNQSIWMFDDEIFGDQFNQASRQPLTVNQKNEFLYADVATEYDSSSCSLRETDMPTEAVLEPSDAGYSLLLGRNLVVGALRLSVINTLPESCSFAGLARHSTIPACLKRSAISDVRPSDNYADPLELTDWDLFATDPDTLSTMALVYDMDSGNVTSRRSTMWDFLWQYNTNLSFASVRFTSLDFTVYNPNIAVFAAVRLASYFSAAGSVYSNTIIYGARPSKDRFGPSLPFQIVLAAMILLESLLLMNRLRATGIRKGARMKWNWLDVIVIGMIIIILGLDISNSIQANGLDFDLTTTSFVTVWPLAVRQQTETDLLALTLLFMVLRFVRFLRMIPGWGPMLQAFITTAQDRTVVLFLTVVVMLILTFAMTFHIAFGAQNPAFASVLRACYSLFGMGFLGEIQSTLASKPRIVSTLLFLLYAVVAIMLLNLFVGIITEVYPRASRESTRQWEDRITNQMERNILHRRTSNRSSVAVLHVLKHLKDGSTNIVTNTEQKNQRFPAHPMFDLASYVVGAHLAWMTLLDEELEDGEADESDK